MYSNLFLIIYRGSLGHKNDLIPTQSDWSKVKGSADEQPEKKIGKC